MAETNQTISGTVLFETDDDLSETNLGAAAAQGNAVDYVVRGCGFSVNHTNDTITIGSTGTRANYAIIENPSNHVAYNVYPDQETDIALPNSSATCHVFIDYDPSTDTAEYHIDDDDTAPSEPSLKIGTVDTSADTSTELNRDPSMAAEDLDISGLVAGTTLDLIRADVTSDNAGFGVVGKQTDGVSTSAETILNPSITGGIGAAIVVVQGDEQGGINRFMDAVLYSMGATAGTSVLDSVTQNSPAGRTYTQSSNALQLAMASSTYDIVAGALITERDANTTS